jgi:hypothetical protein
MRIGINYFSHVVKHKAQNLVAALESKGVELVSCDEDAAGYITYNIHPIGLKGVAKAIADRKKIISIQEAMYAIGWPGTVAGMRKECENANALNIQQVVWSHFETQNYIRTGRHSDKIVHLGNPEHDFSPQKVTRESLGIADEDFVIAYIGQYEHPRGGPTQEQLDLMQQQVQKLKKLGAKILICPHPKNKTKLVKEKDVFIRPFHYPIFDNLRMADLIVTLSSTEGITAAIFGKPIIEFDISNSPERWPFVYHGVAVRATNKLELVAHTKKFMAGGKLAPTVSYKEAYHIDGNISNKVADYIIGYFEGKQ